MANIGVITEQNDLGLGFDPLNAKDQIVYAEAVKNNEKKSQNEDDNKKNSNQ